MKKIRQIILCFIIAVSAGCGSRSEDTAAKQTPAPKPSETPQSAETPDTQIQETEEPSPQTEELTAEIDLTVLSSTAVYSQVYNMVIEPEELIGKTVKMRGEFAYFYDETRDRMFFGCIIRDALACCAQGLEFELAGDYVWPDDYPQEGEEVTVWGIFDTYTETFDDHEIISSYLRDAVLIR